jgi:hypothetical protein
VGVAVWIPKLSEATRPSWEVTDLIMERFDIPALAIKGMAPADTSGCPSFDLCGVAASRGCSKCPDPRMWNNGCICQERDKNSNASAQPGTVVQADYSACPEYDKCGVLAAKGCSKCPDKTWTNDGCACHQAVSPEQFFHGLGSAMSMVGQGVASMFGMTKKPTVMSMGLRATVEVMNPNPIKAETQTGIFRIRYKGLEIGYAETDPVDVAAGGSTNMIANVDVDNVPADVGMMMLQEILQTGEQLSLVVEGSVVAKVHPLNVNCTVECKLRADVSKLPQVSFAQKDCTYGYSV